MSELELVQNSWYRVKQETRRLGSNNADTTQKNNLAKTRQREHVRYPHGITCLDVEAVDEDEDDEEDGCRSFKTISVEMKRSHFAISCVSSSQMKRVSSRPRYMAQEH